MLEGLCEKDKAESLLIRYEKLRHDIASRALARRECRFDLALMQAGGMIALISSSINLGMPQMREMKQSVEGLHEIGRIIGRMATKVTTI